MTARKTATPIVPVDVRADALSTIIAHALTLPTQASIADVLGVNDKSLRGRSRAATLKHADGNATPSFHASREGAKPPQRVVEALVYTFAPADADACVKLAESIGK